MNSGIAHTVRPLLTFRICELLRGPIRQTITHLSFPRQHDQLLTLSKTYSLSSTLQAFLKRFQFMSCRERVAMIDGTRAGSLSRLLVKMSSVSAPTTERWTNDKT